MFSLSEGGHGRHTIFPLDIKGSVSPLFLSVPNLHPGSHPDRLPEMTDGFIRHHHGRNAVLFTEVESPKREVIHLLRRPGGEGDHLIIPVRTPFGLHDIPTSDLGGLSGAGPCPLNIDDDTGGLGKSGISDRLLHQTESGS